MAKGRLNRRPQNQHCIPGIPIVRLVPYRPALRPDITIANIRIEENDFGEKGQKSKDG